MSSRSFARLGLVVAALFTVCAGVAQGTTIVPMTDEDLVVSVRAIVEGHVLREEPLWDARRGAVVTYVTVDVETVYKGALGPGPIVFKQLGGRTRSHITEVSGTPALLPGSHVLLFLNTDSAGVLRVAHVSLGAYTIVSDPVSGVEMAVRDASDAAIVAGPVRAGAVTNSAPRAGFVASILATLAAEPERVASFESRYAGTPLLAAPPEYPARATAAEVTLPSYSFLAPGFRWFEPDTGGVVAMRVNLNKGPTPSRGVDEAKLALKAWSSISGSNLRMVLAGTTTAGGRLQDGVSSISFGDPLNEMDDPVNCSGVVAVSGVTATLREQIIIGGRTFVRIAEGDVVVNDGFDCLLSDSIALSEVVTHEVGHAIGFGHSSDSAGEPDPVKRDATMFFITHLDDRGATLRQDDVEAARFLYKGAGSSRPLQVLSRALPDALAGAVYSYTLDQAGGASPFVWSLVSGSLPAGVRLSQDGHLYGMPSRVGTSTFVVALRDSAGQQQQLAATIRTTSSPAPFVERVTYRDDINRLMITGYYLAPGATVTINGQIVADGDAVKYKVRRRQLVVSGSTSRLNILPAGQNTLTIAIGGAVSNTATF